MELEKFCPSCGRKADTLYGEKKKFCADCFPEKNRLLEIPDVVELEICSTCGRMKKSGEWLEEYTLEDQLGALFEKFSKEDVKMELQYWEEDQKTFVRAHAEKDELQDFYDTELRVEKSQCDSCAKFQGGFFKVKMQLRGDQDLEPVSNRVADKAAEATNQDRNDFLSNIEKNSDGFNFYFSTEKIAGKVLDMLKTFYDPEIKRSYELVTERDGEKVYRNVISVRLED
ncbi:MAG: NMD3-related protein [Candidatus Nanohaloarchaea archaeon]